MKSKFTLLIFILLCILGCGDESTMDTNLDSIADFEKLDYWTTDQISKIEIDNNVSFEGEYSVKFSSYGLYEGHACITEDFLVEPNNNYEISFVVKRYNSTEVSKTNKGGVTLPIDSFFDDFSVRVSQSDQVLVDYLVNFSEENSWMQESIIFQSLTNEPVEVCIITGTVYDYWIDSFSFNNLE